MKEVDLLIVGGVKDPNIGILAAAARKMNRSVVALTCGDLVEPCVSWSLDDKQLLLNGQCVVPRGAFLRQDVFSYNDSMRPDVLDKGLAWHAAVTGAIFSDERVKVFNRCMDWRTASKPIMLQLARQHGLTLPETVVSNCEDLIVSLHERFPRVVKPVAGGAYCQKLEDLLEEPPWKNGAAPVPAIVQDRLDYPEYRIYVVGSRLFAYQIVSEVIDYRMDRRSKIVPIGIESLPNEIPTGLVSLAIAVGIDFGAADLKTRAATGEICFLELNNQPMFAAHDVASGGELALAIVEQLTDPAHRTAIGAGLDVTPTETLESR